MAVGLPVEQEEVILILRCGFTVGIQGCIKTAQTRIGNGGGGQTGAFIGVIGACVDLFAGDQLALIIIINCVVNGGIGIQIGIFSRLTQSVVEYRSDGVAFHVGSFFLFHDGCHDNDLIQRVVTLFEQFLDLLILQLFLEVREHGVDNADLVPYEDLVGIGEEITLQPVISLGQILEEVILKIIIGQNVLQCCSVGIALLHQEIYDLRLRIALGDGDLCGLAGFTGLFDGGDDLFIGEIGVELIFAVLEAAALFKFTVAAEHQSAVNNLVFLQDLADLTHRGALGNGDHNDLIFLNKGIDIIGGDHNTPSQKQCNGDQY